MKRAAEFVLLGSLARPCSRQKLLNAISIKGFSAKIKSRFVMSFSSGTKLKPRTISGDTFVAKRHA